MYESPESWMQTILNTMEDSYGRCIWRLRTIHMKDLRESSEGYILNICMEALNSLTWKTCEKALNGSDELCGWQLNKTCFSYMIHLTALNVNTALLCERLGWGWYPSSNGFIRNPLMRTLEAVHWKTVRTTWHFNMFYGSVAPKVTNGQCCSRKKIEVSDVRFIRKLR